MTNFSAISCGEHVSCWPNESDVCFVLDRYTLSSIFSAISKKQVHRKTHYTDSKPISLCSFSLMPSAKQTSNNDLFFVIVCYPFEWKHMCGGFSLFFFLLYCCRKSKYQEGKVGISFCCLSRKHACACPHPGPWFQNQSQIFIKLFMV